MKTLSLKKIGLFCAICVAAIFTNTNTAVSQTVYECQALAISLFGTSNLHDWEMKAIKGNSEASFNVDAKGIITSLSKLSFSMLAKSLKSEHTAMDNNTYKALNTDKNPNISFAGSSSTITATGSNNYQLVCQGKLTIAGTTKQIELVATGKYNTAEKSFTVTGVKKMKMTDYNVKPPKALFGTIKTGDECQVQRA